MAPSGNLAKEIGQIVNSSYPVSLGNLSAILNDDEDHSVFRQFANTNLCAISRLAHRVKDELELRPDTVYVLEQLCVSRTFRDVIVKQAPGLLDLLVSQATTSSGSQKYYNIVLLFLSSPLPDGTSLPAAAQEFFLHITKAAIETPTLPAFWAVYTILSGACKNLPRLIPQSTVDRLQEDLSRIAKNGKTLHEQQLPVVCLGILAFLVPPSRSVSSHGQPQVRSPASSFFSGTSAFRSMGLAALQALWNCKSSRVSSAEEAARILDISINIFNKIESDTREAWLKTDAGGVNTERIRKKCSEDDIHPQTRLKLFAILMLLNPPTSTNSDVAEFEKFILGFSETDLEVPESEELLQATMESYGPFLSPLALQRLLKNIIQAVCKSDGPVDLSRLRFCQIQVNALCQAAQGNSNLQQAILCSIRIANGGILQPLLNWEFRQPQCTGAEDCKVGLTSSCRQVAQSVLSTILNSLPAMNKDTRSVADLVPFIVQKFQHLTLSGAECKSTRRQRRILSPSEVESSPNTFSGGSTWQEKIETYAEIEISSRSKSLVRLVHQICGDLANAEEPLQREKARSAELDRCIAELTEENHTLKANILDKDIALGALENQMSDSSQVNAAIASENNALLDRVGVLERKLHEALEIGSVQLSEIQKKLDQQQLELQISHESKEAMSVEFESKLAQAKDDNERLRATNREQKEVEHRLQTDNALMNSQFTECKIQLDKETSAVVQLQVEKFDAEQQLLAIRKNLAEVDVRYNEAIAGIERMRMDHDRALKDQEAKITSMKSEHEVSMQDKSNEALRKQKALQSKVEDAYDAFRQEKAALERTLGQRDSVINGLEDETQHLNSIISEQDALISNLKAMRKIGDAAFTGGMDEARQYRLPANAKHMRAHTRNTSSPVSRRRSRRQTVQFDEESQKGDQDDTESPIRPGTSTGSASSSSGPTPKRAKPRIMPRVPVSQSAKAHNAAISQSSRSRPPLSDVSFDRGNVSPTKTRLLVGLTKERTVAGVLEEKSIDDDLLAMADDIDFSLSHLTSTPPIAFGRQSGAKGKLGAERDPDSTMDE